MRKEYEAPKLFVDEFVPDTMIASSAVGKNGNAGEDGECWGCDIVAGKPELGPYCMGAAYPGC